MLPKMSTLGCSPIIGGKPKIISAESPSASILFPLQVNQPFSSRHGILQKFPVGFMSAVTHGTLQTQGFTVPGSLKNTHHPPPLNISPKRREVLILTAEVVMQMQSRQTTFAALLRHFSHLLK